ncbi:hypothetical protein AgCh_012009 [Apium graveolens]
MSSVQVFHGKNNAKRTRMDKSIVGNDIPYLPEGIISEILSYLEVKSLLVCKSVCKLCDRTCNDFLFQVIDLGHPGTGKNIEVAETMVSLKGMQPEKGPFTEIEKATEISALNYFDGFPQTKSVLDEFYIRC